MLKCKTSAGYETGPDRNGDNACRAKELNPVARNCGVPSGPSRREFLAGVGASLAVLVLGIPQAGITSSPIAKIGLILPEGGIAGDEAKSIAAGFDLYWKEKGSPTPEIFRKDSGPNDETALEALADLAVNKGVRFLIGPPTLEGSEKVVHGLTAGKAILFVTNQSVRLVAGEMCKSATFRLAANSWQASQPLAPWALRNLGRKVFITGLDDQQCNEEADFFAYGFDRAGGTFGNRLMVGTRSGDMDAVVLAAANAGPDFVFAAFRGSKAEDFLKVWRGASAVQKLPVIGPEDLTAFPRTLKRLGSASSGVKTLTAMKEAVEFEDRLRKQLGQEVPYAARAAEGYDIAQVVSRALEEESLDKNNVSELARFIEEVEISGPRGKIRFDKNHEPILDMMVQEWHISGDTWISKVVADLGTCTSPDFGCGKVGFPRRPGPEIKDEEPAWVDDE